MRKNMSVVTSRCAAAAVVSTVVLRRPTKEYTHRYSMMHRRLTTAGIRVAPHNHQSLVLLLLLYVYCSRAHPHFPYNINFEGVACRILFTSIANTPKTRWEGNTSKYVIFEMLKTSIYYYYILRVYIHTSKYQVVFITFTFQLKS